jgi:predicted nucleic acid-binding protein
LIFLDTNVTSEASKNASDSPVTAWLVRHEAELVLPPVAVAVIAFSIQKSARISVQIVWKRDSWVASLVLQQDVLPSRKTRNLPMGYHVGEAAWQERGPVEESGLKLLERRKRGG